MVNNGQKFTDGVLAKSKNSILFLVKSKNLINLLSLDGYLVGLIMTSGWRKDFLYSRKWFLVLKKKMHIYRLFLKGATDLDNCFRQKTLLGSYTRSACNLLKWNL